METMKRKLPKWKRYTQADIEYIREHYGKKNTQEIVNVLGRSSAFCIHKKANVMGISKKVPHGENWIYWVNLIRRFPRFSFELIDLGYNPNNSFTRLMRTARKYGIKIKMLRLRKIHTHILWQEIDDHACLAMLRTKELYIKKGKQITNNFCTIRRAILGKKLFAEKIK